MKCGNIAVTKRSICPTCSAEKVAKPHLVHLWIFNYHWKVTEVASDDSLPPVVSIHLRWYQILSGDTCTIPRTPKGSFMIWFQCWNPRAIREPAFTQTSNFKAAELGWMYLTQTSCCLMPFQKTQAVVLVCSCPKQPQSNGTTELPSTAGPCSIQQCSSPNLSSRFTRSKLS